MMEQKYPTTPDGRYFVHRDRLWRCTNPALSDSTRGRIVHELMAARRAVRRAKRANDDSAIRAARKQVQQAKVKLGERGPTWWDDRTDYNRYQVENSPYQQWWRDRALDSRSSETPS